MASPNKQFFVQIIGLKNNEENTDRSSSSTITHEANSEDSQLPGSLVMTVESVKQENDSEIIEAENQLSPAKKPKILGNNFKNCQTVKSPTGASVQKSQTGEIDVKNFQLVTFHYDASKTSADVEKDTGVCSEKANSGISNITEGRRLQRKVAERKSWCKTQQTQPRTEKSPLIVSTSLTGNRHQSARRKVPHLHENTQTSKTTTTTPPRNSEKSQEVAATRKTPLRARKKVRRLISDDESDSEKEAELGNESDGTSTTVESDSDEEFTIPDDEDEDSDGDSVIETSDGDEWVVYEVFPSSSPRGKDKLFDSLGYSYVLHRKSKTGDKTHLHWRCAVRAGKGKQNCRASVMQVGDKFHRSKQPHVHAIPADEKEAPKDKSHPQHSQPSSSAPVSPRRSARASTLRKKKFQNTEKASHSSEISSISLKYADSSAVDEGITYEVKPAASQRKRDKLFDSLGFSYIMGRRSEAGDKTIWKCPSHSKRSKTPNCRASVMQVGDKFYRSKDSHNHEKSPGKKPVPDKDHLKSEREAKHLVAFKQRWEEAADLGITFKVVPCATIRRRDKLVDSLGFYYVSRGERSKDGKTFTVWRCPAYGGKCKTCPARVMQDGDRFFCSKVRHTHEKPAAGKLGPSRREMQRRIKEERKQNPDQSTKKRSDSTKWKNNRLLGMSTSLLSSAEENGDKSVVHTDNNDSELSMSMTYLKEEDSELVMMDSDVRYEIIPSGSTRGRDKLFDSRGYCYVIRRGSVSGDRVYWRCPIHNGKVKYCPANVVQEGDKFYRSKTDHVHECNFGPVLAIAPPGSEIYRIAQEYQRTQQLVESAIEAAEIKNTQDVQPRKKPRRPPTQDLLEEDINVEDPSGRYRIVKAGSMRGHNKLFDNEGYSYAFKHKMKDGAIKWRCTIRNKTYRSCRASVLQRGSHFEQYSGPHIHPAKEGEEVANIISQKLRQAVERQPHKASSVLITEVLEEFLQGMPCPTLPSLNSLSRVIRYHRSRILEKSSGVDITNPDMKGYRMIGSQTPTVGKEVMEALARELQEDGAVALEEVESEVVESEVVESEVVESEVVF